MSDITIGRHRILIGDVRERLAELPAESIDACVCDPPYGLTTGKKGGSGPASLNLDSPAGRSRITTGEKGFMGMKWDGSGVELDPATWATIARVLKPGGHLLAFGGTRTVHRIACAIEDAGFEIRDTILYWGFFSGFPKSRNLSGEWEGWGSALKPGHVLGSGTTGIAAALEGFTFVGCELSPEYVEIAERRMTHWIREHSPRTDDLPLFAGMEMG